MKICNRRLSGVMLSELVLKRGKDSSSQEGTERGKEWETNEHEVG